MTFAADIRHRFAEVNGIRMHYAEAGSGPPAGGGPSVLMLHGFPEFWYSWRFQLPALAALGYHAIAPDMRGYNLTDKPRGGYDIDTLVGDVLALARVAAPGAPRFHLVGHDWGGIIAWQVAARHPERLLSLVVMNAPHPTAFARYSSRHPAQMLKSAYMLAFQAPRAPEWLLTRDGAAAIGSALKRSASRRGTFTADDIAAYRAAFLRPGSANAAVNYYRRAVRQGGRALPRGRIRVPALVLWGEDDPVLERGLNERLAAWVEAPTIRYLAGCGHWTQQEQPEAVNSALADWLGAHPSAS